MYNVQLNVLLLDNIYAHTKSKFKEIVNGMTGVVLCHIFMVTVRHFQTLIFLIGIENRN